jgi:hypothetical protein
VTLVVVNHHGLSTLGVQLKCAATPLHVFDKVGNSHGALDPDPAGVIDNARHPFADFNRGRPVQMDNNISLQSISPNHGESPSPSGACAPPAPKGCAPQLNWISRPLTRVRGDGGREIRWP